jgi:hypothetical protein
LHLEESEFISAVKEHTLIIQLRTKSKNEIGGARSSYGGWKRRVQGFGGETGGAETYSDMGAATIL